LLELAAHETPDHLLELLQAPIDEAAELLTARVGLPCPERVADRLQLARDVADAQRLLHALRVLSFLEGALDALHAGALGGLAEQAFEPCRILRQQRPRQLRRLDSPAPARKRARSSSSC
jgi:hypothetical protein